MGFGALLSQDKISAQAHSLHEVVLSSNLTELQSGLYDYVSVFAECTDGDAGRKNPAAHAPTEVYRYADVH